MDGTGSGGKKNRQKERRLMKGFNIAPPPAATGSPLPPVSELMQTLSEQNSQDYATTLTNLFPGITPKKQLHGNQMHQYSSSQSSFGDTHHVMSKLGKFAPKFHTKRNVTHKKRWGTLIEAAKSGSARFIGRSRSEDSVCNTPSNARIESVSQSNSPGSEEGATDTQTDSNPSLDRPDNNNGSCSGGGGGGGLGGGGVGSNRNNKKEHNYHHLHGSGRGRVNYFLMNKKGNC